MPKFTIPNEKIEIEDRELVGRKFANFSYLRNLPNVSLTNGFFVTGEAFSETLKNHWEQINSLLSSEESSLQLIQEAKSLIADRLRLPGELRIEIWQKAKKLRWPLFLEASLVYPDKKPEANIFSAAIPKPKKLSETVIAAYLAFLEPQTVTRIPPTELKNITIALSIVEKIFPEVAGTTRSSLFSRNKVNILSGWGEFDERLAKDRATVNKSDLTEVSYLISQQTQQILYVKDSYKPLGIAEKFQNIRKLSLENAQAVARVVKHLENDLLSDVEVNFEIAKNRLYITAIKVNQGLVSTVKETTAAIINLPLVTAIKPLLPGIVSGTTRKLSSAADFKKLRTGEIAIVDKLEKNTLPILRKASGIIINTKQSLKGHQLAELRNLGITSAIGIISNLPTTVITLDSRYGRVYRGAYTPSKPNQLKPTQKSPETKVIKTATKIFATIPYSSERLKIDLSSCDGIGPIQAKAIFQTSKFKEFNITSAEKAKLIDYLTQVCSLAEGKMVIFQPYYPGPESNEILTNQLEIVLNLRNKTGFKNLAVAFSSVRTVPELAALKKQLSANGLHQSPSLKLFLTINLAANIFSLPQIIATGIDGLLVDYWELANNLYQQNFSYFELVNFSDLALETCLREIAATARKNQLPLLVFSFPAEKIKELATILVESGTTHLSTNWQLVDQLRTQLSEIESKLTAAKK